MNERRFRQLNILTIIAVAVGIGMMLFFAFVVSDGGNQKISFRTPKKLDDTWVLYRQGESDEQIIDLPTKLKAKKGEIITITHQMPEDAGEDSAICFYTEFQNVIVSIGDRRVYESGVLADNKMTKNAVPGYHVVDIDARAGETVTIQLASAYGRYSGRIPGILLWFAWRYCIVAHTEKWYSVCCVTDDLSTYDPAWRVTVIYDK